jgi:hypothetical protein
LALADDASKRIAFNEIRGKTVRGAWNDRIGWLRSERGDSGTADHGVQDNKVFRRHGESRWGKLAGRMDNQVIRVGGSALCARRILGPACGGV